MNRRQRIALQSPCLLSIETMRPEFAHIDRGHSTVLTVNRGYE